MANTLLDFVMSLVRDPAAAAHYAADPAQAIADAHLTDVTSADVNNLIPVVSESLTAAGAPFGDPGALGSGGNIWASGAATAAFDAFGDHVPVDNFTHAWDTTGWDTTASRVIDSGALDHSIASGSIIDDIGAAAQPLGDVSLQLNEPVVDDAPIVDPAADAGWDHPIVDAVHHTDDPGGFDIFD